MQEVADILTWQEPSDVPALWRRRYEDLLEARIRAVASTAEHSCILETLAMLPRARQRAFLRAPQTASRVLGAAACGFDAGPLAKSLLAELAAAGVLTELPEPVWTVLGDRRLDPAVPAGWSAASAGVAGTPIVLDAAGPTDYSCFATGRLVAPAAEERSATERKLAESAAAIARVSPAALGFWADCIDVVALRKTEGAASRPSSNSFLRNARLTLVVDGHSAALDRPALADAVLHEAIHSLLLTYEEIEAPFVPRGSAGERLSLRSPWSGKDLLLPAYLHAAIIWYGLFWFWSAAAASGAWPEARCAAMRERARAGFRQRPFSSLPAEAAPFLAPAIAALLREIERRMARAEA